MLSGKKGRMRVAHAHLSMRPISEVQLKEQGSAPCLDQRIVGPADVLDVHQFREQLNVHKAPRLPLFRALGNNNNNNNWNNNNNNWNNNNKGRRDTDPDDYDRSSTVGDSRMLNSVVKPLARVDEKSDGRLIAPAMLSPWTAPWETKDPHSVIDVCAATVLSIDRMARLCRLMGLWDGYVSAVMYIKNKAEHTAFQTFLSALKNEHDERKAISQLGALTDDKYGLSAQCIRLVRQRASLHVMYSDDGWSEQDEMETPEKNGNGQTNQRSQNRVSPPLSVGGGGAAAAEKERDLDREPPLFPVNRMRNLAIQNCPTTHYLNLDVDFMPSTGLRAKTRNVLINEARALDPLVFRRTAYVLAAFELDDQPESDDNDDTDSEDDNDSIDDGGGGGGGGDNDLKANSDTEEDEKPVQAGVGNDRDDDKEPDEEFRPSKKRRRREKRRSGVSNSGSGVHKKKNKSRLTKHEIVDANQLPRTKDRAVALHRAGLLRQIHVKFAPEAHKATDYERWYRDRNNYEIEFSAYYEPYYIAAVHDLIPFDERFRGYGWDKAQQAYEMSRFNWRFVVLADGHLIHLTHKPKAWRLSRESIAWARIWKNWHSYFYEIEREVCRRRHESFDWAYLVDQSFLDWSPWKDSDELLDPCLFSSHDYKGHRLLLDINNQ